MAPYIDDYSPGIVLITGGCGNGAMCSDEIGRLGAKLSTKVLWTSDKIPREKASIKWRRIEKENWNHPVKQPSQISFNPIHVISDSSLEKHNLL